MIAEQIGVGLTMYRHGPVSLRAAVFGSGLLYRFVLDSEESDGVMVGGALMVGLYDSVELFGGGAAILAPTADGSDGSLRPVLLFGAQVPLADYLERL